MVELLCRLIGSWLLAVDGLSGSAFLGVKGVRAEMN